MFEGQQDSLLLNTVLLLFYLTSFLLPFFLNQAVTMRINERWVPSSRQSKLKTSSSSFSSSSSSYAMVPGSKAGKRIKGPPFVLELTIVKAINVDVTAEWRYESYYVVASVEHGHCATTCSRPTPEWNETLKMGFWEDRHRELQLEVVREGVLSDPGTSRGWTVVGRAQVPLPSKVGEMATYLLHLVQPREIVEARNSEVGSRIFIEMIVKLLTG